MKDILRNLLENKISLEDAEKLLKVNIVEEIGEVAKLDIFRKTRTGIPEVIFAQNKDPQILIDIIFGFLKNKKFAIISRFTEEQKYLISENLGNNTDYIIEINSLGKIIVIKEKSFKFNKKGGVVGIITAGSSDIPVATEAKVISELMGSKVITSFDVGISGIHRIFAPLRNMIINGVHVLIVCAGMEGTLPGVVAALVDIPVIGVPISSGYGIGEKGKGALITMLQSCSPGLLVVNIDNGFGAGASAALIANKTAEKS
ncbi:MAG TPA: nickel pincer cofactor biosynthesis protein LarB [archaeon]|nr:nickel pincer cofactor biosynthesis protein LarB [archaeon]